MHTRSRRRVASFLCTAVVTAALTWAPPAAAQSGDFGGQTWTFVDPGNASGTVGAGQMQVIGPDGAGGTCFHGVAAYFETVAPLSGTVSVTLDWTSLDLCHYDWPVYVIDGVATVIPTTGSLGCFGANVLQVEFDVVAGQAIGLGVGSADCFKGPGIATWTGFSLLPDEWIDLGQALDPRLEFEIVDAGAGVDLGANVASVGDVNGDGVAEFVVSAPQGFVSSQVSLRRGTTGGQLWSVSGNPTFGASFAAPGDVDGDGDPDVAVGAYAASRVDMLSGADGSVIWSWTWSGSSLDDYAGSLAVHADVDNDGVLDIAVGTNQNQSHSVLVLSGADGTQVREILPAPGDDRFGGALGDMGDLDGDDVTDLAVRASATPPVVRIYSGDDASILLEIDAADGLPSGGLNGFNSARLLGLPDVDGDAVRDLAVGAPQSSVFFNDFSGSVAVYSGATGDQLWQVAGADIGDRLGSALAAVDTDGDGTPELAAGAYGHELVPGQFEDNGLVWIMDATDGSQRLEMEGPPGGGSLGLGLATLDGAAQPTLLVGVPEHPEGSRVQAVSDLTHVHGAPKLGMFGPLVSDTPWALRITDGAGSLPVGIVLGLSQIDAPLLGGTLVPDADWVFWAQLDPAGRLLLQGTWPPGVEAAPPLWLQAWIPDPAGPQGWSATNALRSL